MAAPAPGPEPDQGGQADLLDGPLGDELRAALGLAEHGHAEAARAALLHCQRTALAQGDPALAALIASHLAQALVELGKPQPALQVLMDALATLPAPEPALRARLLAQAAPLHFDPQAGLELAAQADQLAGRVEDPRVRVGTLQVLLALLVQGGHADGIRVVAKGLADQASWIGDRAGQTQGLLAWARQLQADGERAEALDLARQAHAAALLLDDAQRALRASAAGFRGTLARAAGQALEALDALDTALLDGGLHHPEADDWRLQRALARLSMGTQVDGARDDLRSLGQSDNAQLAQRAVQALCLSAVDAGDLATATHLVQELPADARAAVQAQVDLAQGHFVEAAQRLEQLAQAFPQDSSVAFAWAKALRACGQHAAALAVVDPWLARAEQDGDDWLELQGRLARTPTLAALGDHDAARQDARRAAALSADLHLPLHHVTACGWVALSLARLELVAEALAELHAASEFAARLGASAAALQAALAHTLLDSGAVRQGLQGRDVADVAAAISPPGLAAAVLLTLCRRALADGDRALAQALLDRARRADGGRGGQLSDQVAQLAAQLEADR